MSTYRNRALGRAAEKRAALGLDTLRDRMPITVASIGGQITSFDLASGAVRWQYDPPRRMQTLTADDTVVVAPLTCSARSSFQTYALITLRRAGNDRQLFLDNVGKEVFVRGCLARNGRKNYAAAGTLKFSDGVMRQVGQLQD